jgi:tetratricopeptide (TPR) repeat protein/O-antigen ligase
LPIPGNSDARFPPTPNLRWILASCSLLIPFVLVPSIFDPFQLPKEIFFSLTVILIFGAWLGGVVRTGRVRLMRTGVTTPMLLLLFLCILSSFQAAYPQEVLRNARGAVLVALAFTVAASSLRQNDRLVPGALALAGLLTASLGLAQLLAGPRASLLPPTMGGGLIGDVTIASLFVAIVLPLLLYFAFPYRGALAWVWGSGAGLAAAFVVLARSRSGWMAALLGLLWLGYAKLFRANRSSPAGEEARGSGILLLCASLILAVGVILCGIYVSGIHLSSSPPSFKVSELEGWELRQDAWRITRGMMLYHPLGVGAGSWSHVFAAEAGNSPLRTGFSASRLPLNAGNEYLQIGAELGLTGLLLFLWLGFGLIRKGWRSTGGRETSLADAYTACLWGVFAACFLSNPLREEPLIWTVTILAALICVEAPSASRGLALSALEWEMVPSRRKPLGAAILMLFLALTGLMLWDASRVLLSAADLKAGQAACAAGDRSRGLQILLRASALDPTSATIRAAAGSCALRGGKLDVADKEIRASLQLNPLDASSWLTLATILKEQGRFIDATAACEKAKSFWPRDEKINLFLGDLRKATGDTLGAADAYQAALAGNPSSVEAYVREGQVLMVRGQIVNAVMALSHAANMDPFSPGVLLQLGAAYTREGDYDSAVQTYRSLLQLNEEDPDAMLGLAGAFSGQEHYCDAIPLLKKAQSLQTDPSRAASIGAMVEQMTRRCEKSKLAPKVDRVR